MLRLISKESPVMRASVVGRVASIRFLSTASEKFNVVGWFRTPQKVFCQPGCLKAALSEYYQKKRVFVVTDQSLVQLGISKKVTDLLDSYKYQYQLFSHVEPDPILGNVLEGLKEMQAFKPDVIVAIGGGSPMDTAKVMRVLYENPKHTFASFAERCKDIRVRTREEEANPLISGALVDLVCIPTTSGTGSDVTPYAVITDETSETNDHHVLADHSLMPSMSIVDAELAMNLPPVLTAHSGLFALAHAIESQASPLASDFTRAMSFQAASLIFKHLPLAFAEGSKAPESREALHHAGTMAGMALANTSPGGVCHALAHRLCSSFRLSPGLAHAALLPHAVSVEAATSPAARKRYAELAVQLGCSGSDEQTSVTELIQKVEKLKAAVGVPPMLMDVVDPKTDHRDILELRMREITAAAAADAAALAAASGTRSPSQADLRKLLQTAWDGPAV